MTSYSAHGDWRLDSLIHPCRRVSAARCLASSAEETLDKNAGGVLLIAGGVLLIAGGLLAFLPVSRLGCFRLAWRCLPEDVPAFRSMRYKVLN